MKRFLAISLMVFTFAPSLPAATKIFLRSTSSDLAGYQEALVTAGAALTTSITNTTSGGTDIQVTVSAGGATVAWISKPLVSGFTLSGSVTCNLWGLESATQANASFRCRLYKYSGSEGAALVTPQSASELSTSAAVKNFSATPTSTAFAAGDRIVVKVFLENCGSTSGCPTGTMGASRTVTMNYNAGTGGANGDTWAQINENVTFYTPYAAAAPVALNLSPAEANRLARQKAAAASVSFSPAGLGVMPAAIRGAAAAVALSCPVCVESNQPLNVALGIDPTATVSGGSGSRGGEAGVNFGVECQACRSVPLTGVSLGIAPAIATLRVLQDPVAAALALSPTVARTLGRRGTSVASLAFSPSVLTAKSIGRVPIVAIALSTSTGIKTDLTTEVTIGFGMNTSAMVTAEGTLGKAAAAALAIAPAVARLRGGVGVPAVALTFSVSTGSVAALHKAHAVSLVFSTVATATTNINNGNKRAIIVVVG